jgi:hypothetical protein
VSGFVQFCPVFGEGSIRAPAAVSGFVQFCPVFGEGSIRAPAAVSGIVRFLVERPRRFFIFFATVHARLIDSAHFLFFSRGSSEVTRKFARRIFSSISVPSLPGNAPDNVRDRTAPRSEIA